jgi:TP901 family phage tail tape measure protein
MANDIEVALRLTGGQAFESGMGRAGKATADFAKSSGQSAESTAKAGGALRSFAADAASAAAGFASFAAVSSVVHNVMGTVEQDFLSFDASIVNSTSILEGVTPALRKQFEDVSTAVSTGLNYSASEAADGLYFLASAGKSTEQTLAELPATAQFARAGMLGLSDATDYAVQIQSALGLKSQDTAQDLTNLTRVTDVLTKGSIVSNATIGDLAGALVAKGASAANRFGLSIEEVTGLLAVFADQGIKGRRAGEAVDIVLREMGKGVTENADIWAQWGITVFDAQGKFVGMPTIINELDHALAGASDQQRFMVLSDLGFTAESTAYIGSLLGRGQALTNYTTQLMAAGGATKDVADNQMKSLENRIGVLKEQALAFARDQIPKLVSGVKDIAQEVEPTAKALLDLGEAVGRALAPFARIALGGAIAAFQGLSVALREVAGFLERHQTLVAILAGTIATRLVGGAITGAVQGLKNMAAGFSATATAGQSLAGGIGLLGVALNAAIVGYTLWEAHHGQMQKNVESLSQALQDQTKSVYDNAQSWLANDAAKGGKNALLIEATDLDTVTQAMLGNTTARDALTAAIDRQQAAVDERQPGTATKEGLEPRQISSYLDQGKVNDANAAVKELIKTQEAAAAAAFEAGKRNGDYGDTAIAMAQKVLTSRGELVTMSSLLAEVGFQQEILNTRATDSGTALGGLTGAIGAVVNKAKDVPAVFEGIGESAEEAEKKVDEAVKTLDRAFTALIGGPMALLNSKIDFGDAVEQFDELASKSDTTKEQLDKSATGLVSDLQAVIVQMLKSGKSPEEAAATWKYGLGIILGHTHATKGEIEAELGGIDLDSYAYTIGQGYGSNLAGGIKQSVEAEIGSIAERIKAIFGDGSPSDPVAATADGVKSRSGELKSVFDEHVSRPIANSIADGAHSGAQRAAEEIQGVIIGLGDYTAKAPSAALAGLFGGNGQFASLVNQARQFSGFVQQGINAITQSPTGQRVYADTADPYQDENAHIQAYNQAVQSMAQTYAQLAQTTDQATADMLLSQGLAADEFQRTAQAIEQASQQRQQVLEREAQERKASAQVTATIEDGMYQFGQISTDRYIGLLQKRLSGLVQYSSEWISTWQQIHDATEKLAAPVQSYFQFNASNIDKSFQLGYMGSKSDYLGYLQRQLSAMLTPGTSITENSEVLDLMLKIKGLQEDIASDAKSAADDASRAQKDLLDKAVAAQQSAAQAIAEAWNAVAAPIMKAGSLVDAFSGQLSVSGGTIQSFMAHQVEAAHRWEDALHGLQDAGLDPRILAQLAQEGPQGLGTATGLLGLGAGGIAGINSQYQEIAGIAGSLGGWASQSGGVGGIVLNGGINLNITGADGTVTMADVSAAILAAVGQFGDQIIQRIGA